MAEAKSPGSYMVLLVCTGNTCRSPMAAGLMKKLLAERTGATPLINVVSAGTMGLIGMPATDLAIEVSASYDLSQAATPELLDQADLVLALAADHHEYCRAMGVPAERLFMLRAFPQHPQGLAQYQIPDPIGGNRDQYQRTFYLIEEALRRGLPAIIARANSSETNDEPRGDAS
ncbi:MAG: protein tyrosine phosphatase [candidate division Zixibacteria bacterium]|nr:protein tyrosine phosphatase [candidate division Zixibacteria bacterium]